MEIDTRVAHLWVFRNGKIIRAEVHRTTEEAIQASRTGGGPGASP
jgi:hypothetical protein